MRNYAQWLMYIYIRERLNSNPLFSPLRLCVYIRNNVLQNRARGTPLCVFRKVRERGSNLKGGNRHFHTAYFIVSLFCISVQSRKLGEFRSDVFYEVFVYFIFFAKSAFIDSERSSGSDLSFCYIYKTNLITQFIEITLFNYYDYTICFIIFTLELRKNRSICMRI